MSLQEFRIFASVVEYRNETRAARELRLSQSALSRHLTALQDRVGRLFKKNGRGLELTELGEAFYSDIRALLAQADAIDRKYRRTADSEPLKPICIGGSFGPAKLLLPSLISSFTRLHPSIEIDFTVRNSAYMQESVMNGKVDLAVITNPTPTALLEIEPFETFRLCLFVSAHHPLARARHVSTEMLAKYPLVSGREQRTRNRTNALLGSMKPKGLHPKVLMQCEWPDAIKSVVSEGEAVGILYRDLVKHGVEAGRFKIIDVAGINLSMISYIVYSREKILSQNAQKLRGFLRAARQENALVKSQLRGIAPVDNTDGARGGISPICP